MTSTFFFMIPTNCALFNNFLHVMYDTDLLTSQRKRKKKENSEIVWSNLNKQTNSIPVLRYSSRRLFFLKFL